LLPLARLLLRALRLLLRPGGSRASLRIRLGLLHLSLLWPILLLARLRPSWSGSLRVLFLAARLLRRALLRRMLRGSSDALLLPAGGLLVPALLLFLLTALLIALSVVLRERGQYRPKKQEHRGCTGYR
jgi:hypothetical protein